MTELQDPQLEALYASNPELLRPDRPTSGPTVPQWYDNTVVELAGAILAVRGLVALSLSLESPPSPGQAQALAGQAWNHHSSTWLRVAVPAIQQAYRAGRIQGLTQAEMELMATDYATGLGEYIDTTSADALAEGFQIQLNDRWSESLAWHRATAGYGLDRPDMRTFLRAVLAQPKETRDPIATGARMLVDRLLIARADRIAQSEAWTASQSGLALSWLVRQQRGDLGPDVRKAWRTRRRETVCEVCGPMDGVLADLDGTFALPDGTELFAPGAHPGCQCTLGLVESISKAKRLDDGQWDPHDRDPKGRFAAREYRTRDVTFAEPVSAEVQAVLDELRDFVAEDKPKNAFGVDTRPVNAFGAPKAAAGNAFGRPQGTNAFGVSREVNAFGSAQTGTSPFDLTKKPPRGAVKPKTRRIIHHVFMPKKTEDDSYERATGSYYMPVREYNEAGGWGDSEALEQPGNKVEFTPMADHRARELVLGGGSSQELDELIHQAWPGFEDSDEWASFGDHLEGDPTGPDAIVRAMRDLTALVALRTENAWKDMVPSLDDRTVGDADEGTQMWDQTISPLAYGLWNDVLANPSGHVDKLTRSDLDRIYDLAGYDRGEDDVGARARIIDACSGYGIGDDSLADAFCDHMVWSRPERLGEGGHQLEYLLGQADDMEMPYMQTGASNEPTIEVYTFESGFHPDTQMRLDGRAADVLDDYVVNHVIYRSNIGENHDGAVPFVTGIREVALRPADSYGHPLYGGPYDTPT